MKRLSVERLDLDLRGVSRETAEHAARLLGPALARALEGRRVTASAAESIDAGHVATQATTDAGALAGSVAQRIAEKTSRSRS
jgi:hypothetical protein